LSRFAGGYGPGIRRDDGGVLRHYVANSPSPGWRFVRVTHTLRHDRNYQTLPRRHLRTHRQRLLTKRADLFNEAIRIRDRLAEIKNDIGALDRVLGTLGYTGDLDAEMPRQKREVIFGRGELIRAILGELRGFWASGQPGDGSGYRGG